MTSLPALVRQRYLGAWFLGVCSTLGRWTSTGPLAFRAAVAYGLVFHTTLTIGIYLALGVAGRLFQKSPDDHATHLQLDGPNRPSGNEGMQERFADLNVRLARLEAEALSADAITRARFRNAGL